MYLPTFMLAEVLTCAKNVALQATAMGAEYVRKEDIPADVLATDSFNKLQELVGLSAEIGLTVDLNYNAVRTLYLCLYNTRSRLSARI